MANKIITTVDSLTTSENVNEIFVKDGSDNDIKLLPLSELGFGYNQGALRSIGSPSLTINVGGILTLSDFETNFSTRTVSDGITGIKINDKIVYGVKSDVNNGI